MASFQVPAIGYVQSPYGEKFAVPRQSGLAPHAKSRIFFYPPYGDPEAFRGLEGFSHLFVIFVFDRARPGPFHATVRPPRLGGNERAGVFATRSPYRPSRLGLSAVKLERILNTEGQVSLEISGADLTDGTPVVDIKPYIPFCDSIPDAKGGFAAARPPQLETVLAERARADLASLPEDARQAVLEALSQDPRPAYQQECGGRIYGALLYGRNVRFKISGSKVLVLDAAPAEAV